MLILVATDREVVALGEGWEGQRLQLQNFREEKEVGEQRAQVN